MARPVFGSLVFAPNLITSIQCIAATHSVRWNPRAFSICTGRPKSEGKCAERLAAVVDVVNEQKLPPELRGRSNFLRTETEILNVVEQRIWHSMEEGHFENLPGKGKPLNFTANPHADPAEDTLYRILSKNGCAPEWVELNKEIRSQVRDWRISIKRAWSSRAGDSDPAWIEASTAFRSQMHEINNKVLRYNLIVPFGRQMFGLKWEKELDKLGS